jgi:hypothetical protein
MHLENKRVNCNAQNSLLELCLDVVYSHNIYVNIGLSLCIIVTFLTIKHPDSPNEPTRRKKIK